MRWHDTKKEIDKTKNPLSGLLLKADLKKDNIVFI
jgi:hypothetical protein